MIQGKWFMPGAVPEEAIDLRQECFNRGTDALDAAAWNVLVYEAGAPAATGRLWWAEGAFWLGDICVRSDLRGRGLGDFTLRLLLFKAESHSARIIRLWTPEETEPFFARLGFQRDGGEEIAAAKGVCRMFLRSGELSLECCGGCGKGCSG